MNTECESCIYRTAFLDIASKVKQMAALEQELERLKVESRMKEQEIMAMFGGVNKYESS